MKFKMRVNFYASKIYDVDAETEDEARRIALGEAEREFDFSSKDRENGRFGYICLLCNGCKNELHSNANFCANCGLPRTASGVKA